MVNTGLMLRSTPQVTAWQLSNGASGNQTGSWCHRDMIDPLHVHSLLKFAEIQQKHWKTAVERTVLASVRAFHYLHRSSDTTQDQ
jgi:hypothetical protein